MQYRTVHIAPRTEGEPAAVTGLPLHPTEVRVLGALIEKELTTPEYYPLTLNALLAACNQKSNRDPVVQYDEDQVQQALNQLKQKGLVREVLKADSRVARYRHVALEAFGLSGSQLAALGVLMLRGAQTVGEIRGRSGRMYEFASLEEVQETLEALAGRASLPLVVELPRQPGSREPRYAHLLAGEPALETAPAPEPAPARSASVYAERIAELEQEVASLKDRLEALEQGFEQFRRQFE